MKRMAIMTVPGETEAGSAGKQPRRGIAWWAHRDDDRSAEELSSALFPKAHRIGRPPCLENPRPKGGILQLTEGARSPFHAEPGQSSNILKRSGNHHDTRFENQAASRICRSLTRHSP